MSAELSNDDRERVCEIVSAYKKEGKFDELRRRVLADIMTSEEFSVVAEDAKKQTAEIVSSTPSHLPQNRVRELLREQMSMRFAEAIQTMVGKELGKDNNIRFVLNELEHRVKRSLGIPDDSNADGEEKTKTMEDDHQVCDMEIESDSDEAQQASLGKSDAKKASQMLCEIELPPEKTAQSPSSVCSEADLASPPFEALGHPIAENSSPLHEEDEEGHSAASVSPASASTLSTGDSKIAKELRDSPNVPLDAVDSPCCSRDYLVSPSSSQQSQIVSQQRSEPSKKSKSSTVGNSQKNNAHSLMERARRERKMPCSKDFVYY